MLSKRRIFLFLHCFFKFKTSVFVKFENSFFAFSLTVSTDKMGWLLLKNQQISCYCLYYPYITSRLIAITVKSPKISWHIIVTIYYYITIERFYFPKYSKWKRSFELFQPNIQGLEVQAKNCLLFSNVFLLFRVKNSLAKITSL